MAAKITTTLPTLSSDTAVSRCRPIAEASDITCSPEVRIHFGIGHRAGFQFLFRDPELLAAVIAGQHELAQLLVYFNARQKASTARAFEENFSSTMIAPLQTSKAIRETSRLDHHGTHPRRG